jgi:DNA-binding MarR family transcriptional regulator
MQTVKEKVTRGTPHVRKTPARAKAESLRQALLKLGPTLLRVEDFTLDMPLRQLEVCLALSVSRMTMSEIGRSLGVSLSGLTQIADRLERAGMVERFSNEADRRVRFLQLTSKAQGLMEAHKESQLARIANCLEQFSAAESARLLDSLQKLVDIAAGGLQPGVT